MRTQGKTVFLTTHYMDEAERLCDRIAIVDSGKILALDTPEKLIKSQFAERTIQFTPPIELDPQTFSDLPNVLRVAADGGEITLFSDAVQKSLAALLERAEARSIEIGDVHLRRPTLEDVFLKMTGRRIRE